MGSIACSYDTIKSNRFKKLVYSYDLISGKVNDVAYQPGQADQFYHHYAYDAENRLTEVSVSRDKLSHSKAVVKPTQAFANTITNSAHLCPLQPVMYQQPL